MHSEIDISRSVRQKYGIDPQDVQSGLSDDNQKRVITASLQKIVGQMIDETISSPTHSIDNEHPWLKPLLKTVEIVLFHECKSIENLWTAIHQQSPLSMSVSNVFGFCGLNTGWGRVRAWISLGLMAKSLANDLKTLALYHCYSPKAIINDRFAMDQVAFLLSSLDPIDFNLYIKESEIDDHDPQIDWSELFIYKDILNYRLLSLRLPQNSHDSSNQDLDKLKNALKNQFTQKAFFEEECKRLKEQVGVLHEEVEMLQRAMKVTPDCIEFLSLKERLHSSQRIRSELIRLLKNSNVIK